MMKRRTGMMRILGMFAMNLAVGLLVVGPVGAQNTRNDLHDGPLIEGFGRHVDLPNADFVMRTDDNIYKVAFEIFQPLNAPERPHMRLEAAARFMNMHAHAGIPQKNLQVKLVLHGGGTRAAMTNEAYQERYEMDNPSLPLLEALSDAGVEIFLCEQSRVLNGLDANEVSAPVKSALSAMTAVVTLQADGYQFLTY
ncbi:MAG: DsrE family protein [Acidobacteriota bacterium]|nr:DsrE family protein [Acidobacteriota bacterium]